MCLVSSHIDFVSVLPVGIPYDNVKFNPDLCCTTSTYRGHDRVPATAVVRAQSSCKCATDGSSEKLPRCIAERGRDRGRLEWVAEYWGDIDVALRDVRRSDDIGAEGGKREVECLGYWGEDVEVMVFDVLNRAATCMSCASMRGRIEFLTSNLRFGDLQPPKP